MGRVFGKSSGKRFAAIAGKVAVAAAAVTLTSAAAAEANVTLAENSANTLSVTSSSLGERIEFTRAGATVWDLDVFTLDASVAANATDRCTGTLSNGVWNIHCSGVNHLDVQGNGGDDTLLFWGAEHTSGMGTAAVSAGSGDDYVNDFGSTISGTISGDEGEDLLYGGPAADSIDGGAGCDWVDGKYGDDTLLGGAWNDASCTGANFTHDRVIGDFGNDILRGAGGRDLLSGAEGDDSLLANAGDDELDGGPGNDMLQDGIGDDKLYGQDGLDTGFMSDSIGTDLFNGGNGTDVVDYTARYTGVMVNLNTGNAGSYTQTPMGYLNTESDQIWLVEQAKLSNGDDRAIGDAGNNVFFGLAGDDYLSGSGGADSLRGDSGSDTLHGGSGSDILLNNDGEVDQPINCGGSDVTNTILKDAFDPASISC